MASLRERHGGLAFFVGGDNIVATVPDLAPADYHAALDHVAAETDVSLKVGVGHGPTAADAGMVAKHALERCRHRDADVEVGRERPDPAADD